jgi:hypothetical protein
MGILAEKPQDLKESRSKPETKKIEMPYFADLRQT